MEDKINIVHLMKDVEIGFRLEHCSMQDKLSQEEFNGLFSDLHKFFDNPLAKPYELRCTITNYNQKLEKLMIPYQLDYSFDYYYKGAKFVVKKLKPAPEAEKDGFRRLWDRIASWCDLQDRNIGSDKWDQEEFIRRFQDAFYLMYSWVREPYYESETNDYTIDVVNLLMHDHGIPYRIVHMSTGNKLVYVNL